MVRRGQSRRNSQGKRPSQTIDLSASEVSSSEDEAAQKADKTVSEKAKAGDVSASPSASIETDKKSPDTKSDPKAVTGSKDEKSGSPAGGSGGGGEPPKDVTAKKGASKETPSESGSKTGSFFKLLAASVVGAVLALGGQQFMPRLVTTSDTAALTTLEGEVKDLKSALGGLSTEAQEATARKIGELEQAVLAAQKAAEGGGDVATRLGQVEQTMKDLTSLAKGDDAVAGVAAIATRVNEIEGRVDKAIDSIRSDFSVKFRRELEQVSKEIATQESLTQIEGVKLTASTLGKKLAQLDAQSTQLSQQIEALTSGLETLKENALTKTALNTKLGAIQTELESVSTQLAAVTARESEAHEAARKSALALAFSNLKRAMNRGDGYSNELSAVKRLANQSLDFSLIEPYANSGVPTEQSLLETYPPLAVEALARGETSDDSSTWDKLVSKARTAVNYRRTGDVKGDNNEAVLARMEHKFKDGHVEDVLAEAKALDGQAAQIMAPWLQKLEARLMVERTVQKLEDQLITNLEPR